METPETEALIQSYLQRLQKLLRRAPVVIRDDAIREVRAHIEDEWQALGGTYSALGQALDRLGPPEAYGRDLALQLMIAQASIRRSPADLVFILFFWVSTGLVGSILLVCALLLLAFSVSMAFVGMGKLLGSDLSLFEAHSFQLSNLRYDQFVFPPREWSPFLIITVGLTPVVLFLASVYRVLSRWVNSRPATRGLALAAGQNGTRLSRGWEKRMVAAMAVIAAAGLGGCLLFSLASDMVSIGKPASVSLPQDFFRTPLTFLAFLSGLVFLCAPALALLWAARHNQRLE